MSIEYGYEIKWTGFDGSKTVLSARGFPTRKDMEAVRSAAFEHAKELGWTPPRWWQWWRAGDTKVPR